MSTSVNIHISVSGAAVASTEADKVSTALGRVDDASSGGAQSADRLAQAVQRVGHYGAGLVSLAVFGRYVGDVAAMADQFTGLNARLALATGSTQSASAQFQRLLGIANSMQQPIGEVGSLYVSLARSADNLGASQADMTRFTAGVAASLRVSGTSSQAAAGALQQLSQAMAGSTVQAEEFNSLIDGAPELLRAVAANLHGTGVSMGELRDLVRSGQLSTKDFFDAFLRGSDALTAKAAGLPPTIGGAFTELRNQTVAFVGSADQALGASAALASAISALAKNLDVVVTAGAGFVALFGVRAAQAVAASVSAMLAKRAAMIADLTATNNSAQAIATHTGFVLADARATLAHATGLGASVAAQNAVTEATRRHTAAMAAASASQAALNAGAGLATRALGLLGGPIGIVTTLLTMGVTAWSLWGSSAKDAATEAKEAVLDTSAKTVEKLREETALLQRRTELVRSGIKEERQGSDAQMQALAALSKRIADINAGVGEFASLSAVFRQQEVQKTAKQYAALAIEVDRNAAAKKALADETAAAKKREEDLVAAAKKAAADHDAALKKSRAEVQAFTDSVGTELAKLREANATFGLGEDAVLAYRAAKAGLTQQTQTLRDAIAAERAELQRKTEVDRAVKELAQELTKIRVDQAGALLDEGKAIAEQTAKLRDETLQMGLTKDQLRALERQRLADAIATAEQRLQTALAAGVRAEELDGITLMVEELRQLKQAKEEGWAKEAAIEARDAAKDTASEWAKTVESIEGGLTDALMRAFESGKGFMDAFKSTLVNAFKTLVLQPTIRAVMAPAAGALGGLFGSGGAAAQTAGSAGGSAMGGLGGMLGGLGTISSTIGAGAGWLTGAASFGQIMGAAGSLVGTGSAAGILSGLGMGLGAVAPVLALLPAIKGIGDALFGRKLKDSGIEGTLSTEGMDGNAYRFYKGGLFRSNKTKRDELDPALDGAFDSGLSAVTAQVSAYVDALGLPVSALAGYSEQIKISFKGLDEAQIQQAVADAIGKFQEGLAGLYAGAIGQYQKAGETVLQTLQRLSTLQAFSDTINQFGGAFSSIAQLGIDARESLIGMAGGIEALLGKTRQFVADYYTEEEQAALSARDVFKALSATGLNLGGLDTKAEYRALLEGRDLGTEAGRAQFAALLDASSAFAQLAPYLEKSGQTLDELAQIAPRMAELETLFAPGTQADGTAADLQLGLSDVSQSVADGSADVVGAIRDMRDAVLGGLATVAGNTAASTNYLRDLYDVNAYGGGA